MVLALRAATVGPEAPQGRTGNNALFYKNIALFFI